MPDDFDLGGCEELPASEAPPVALCPVCRERPVTFELRRVGFETVRYHEGRICQPCYDDLYHDPFGQPWDLSEDWREAANLKHGIAD